MPKISFKTIKRLFALSGNVCAYPGCASLMVDPDSRVVIGEVCHIRAAQPGGPRFDPAQATKERHDEVNLMLLCRTHHRLIDAEPERFPVHDLLEMKRIKVERLARPERSADDALVKKLMAEQRRVEVIANSGNVAIDSPGAIQAQILTIKTQTRKVVIDPPPGTIGADPRAARYVSHLIERYNKFAAEYAERKTRFSYGAISRNIISKFGSEWRLVRIEKAHDLFAYLQDRINKTRLARINRAKGMKPFSSYEEFTAKYEG